MAFDFKQGVVTPDTSGQKGGNTSTSTESDTPSPDAHNSSTQQGEEVNDK